jgi:hypothetical protein
MPNISSQLLNQSGITIASSNGNNFTITAAQIRALYLIAVAANAITAMATVRYQIASQIQAALGSDQVSSSKVTIDFDNSTGAAILCNISH